MRKVISIIISCFVLVLIIIPQQVVRANSLDDDYKYHYVINSEGNLLSEKEWDKLQTEGIILGEGEYYLPVKTTSSNNDSTISSIANVRVRSWAIYDGTLDIYIELYANTVTSPKFANMFGTVSIVQLNPWVPGGDYYYSFSQYTTATRTIADYIETGLSFGSGTNLAITVQGTASGFNIIGGDFYISYNAIVP